MDSTHSDTKTTPVDRPDTEPKKGDGAVLHTTDTTGESAPAPSAAAVLTKPAPLTVSPVVPVKPKLSADSGNKSHANGDVSDKSDAIDKAKTKTTGGLGGAPPRSKSPGHKKHGKESTSPQRKRGSRSRSVSPKKGKRSASPKGSKRSVSPGHKGHQKGKRSPSRENKRSTSRDDKDRSHAKHKVRKDSKSPVRKPKGNSKSPSRKTRKDSASPVRSDRKGSKSPPRKTKESSKSSLRKDSKSPVRKAKGDTKDPSNKRDSESPVHGDKTGDTVDTTTTTSALKPIVEHIFILTTDAALVYKHRDSKHPTRDLQADMKLFFRTAYDNLCATKRIRCPCRAADVVPAETKAVHAKSARAMYEQTKFCWEAASLLPEDISQERGTFHEDTIMICMAQGHRLFYRHETTLGPFVDRAFVSFVDANRSMKSVPIEEWLCQRINLQLDGEPEEEDDGEDGVEGETGASQTKGQSSSDEDDDEEDDKSDEEHDPSFAQEESETDEDEYSAEEDEKTSSKKKRSRSRSRSRKSSKREASSTPRPSKKKTVRDESPPSPKKKDAPAKSKATKTKKSVSRSRSASPLPKTKPKKRSAS